MRKASHLCGLPQTPIPHSNHDRNIRPTDRIEVIPQDARPVLPRLPRSRTTWKDPRAIPDQRRLGRCDHKMQWGFFYRVLAQGADTNGKPGDIRITPGGWLITMYRCRFLSYTNAPDNVRCSHSRKWVRGIGESLYYLRKFSVDLNLLQY